MSDNIRQLEDQHASLVADLRQVAEIDSPTAEDEQKFDKISKDIDVVERKIAKAEKLSEQERKMNERVESRAALEGMSKESAAAKEEDEQRTAQDNIREWCREGSIAGRAYGDLRFDLATNPMEVRAETDPQATTSTVGGEFIPTGFRNTLEVARLQFGGPRRVATVFRTERGGTYTMPTTNDTDQKGALLAENTEDSKQKIDTSSVSLGDYKITSKIVLVSVELMQDSAFDVNQWVGSRLGERIGRKESELFTTGTGSSQPKGIVTAATLGVTAAGASSIDFDDLIDLQHSVDPAYRDGAGFMFNDATLKVIRKLKDSNGQYIWNPGTPSQGIPGTVLGQPYTINQDMDSIGGSTKPVLYGLLSKYFIRDVLGITLRRLDERYAEFHQVGFVAIVRTDADLLDAGTNPVKYLQMESA